MSCLLLLPLLFVVPALFLAQSVFAESQTPSLGYTGAVSDYVPTVQQLIHIVVQNPSGSRWGFQITIRGQSDETLSSGTFSIPNPNDPEQVVCDDGTQYGSPAPCASNIARQFAEHLNAPRGATGTAYEFDVLWTPPSQEIGRLQVYVSAVAADGDGTRQGDRVYTDTQTLANAGTCTLAGQPVFQT